MSKNLQINLTAAAVSTMAFVAIFLCLNLENNYFSPAVIIAVALPISIPATVLTLIACHLTKQNALNIGRYTLYAGLSMVALQIYMLPSPQFMIVGALSGAFSGFIGALVASAIFKRQQLPSPSELASPIHATNLKQGRDLLRDALRTSGGQPVTFLALHFPPGTAEILLAEAAASGWKSEFVPNAEQGDYYRISPQ